MLYVVVKLNYKENLLLFVKLNLLNLIRRYTIILAYNNFLICTEFNFGSKYSCPSNLKKKKGTMVNIITIYPKTTIMKNDIS